MLDKLTIFGFRRYSKFTLDNLGKINFILGDNNIGKTTILEAIFTWACGQNILPMIHIPLSRGRYTSMLNSPYWEIEELLTMINDKSTIPFKMKFEGVVNGKIESFTHTILPSDLLTDYDTSYADKKVEFISRNNNNNNLNMLSMAQLQTSNPITIAEWSVTHNDNDKSVEKVLLTAPNIHISSKKPFYYAKYIDVMSQTGIQEISQIYSILKRERLMQEATEEIKKIYQDIDGFDMIPYPDGSVAPVSVIRKDGSILPLYAYGDGVQKWFYILGCFALYRNYILCIDEIDSGFHPKAQKEFSKHLIEKAMQYNVQLFITTHNLEYLDNFLEASIETDKSKDIRIITLEEVKNSVVIRNMNADDAYKARKEFNLEMR